VYSGYTHFKEYDVLVAKVTPCFENGKSGLSRNLTNRIGFGSSEFIVLRANEKINPIFLYLFISHDKFIENGKHQMSGTGGLRRLTKFYVENFEIPLPPLEIQNAIVEQIEKEQSAIDECKKLIEMHEAKIKTKIAEVWGESQNMGLNAP
jgi:restriction endonuclease S subunit